METIIKIVSLCLGISNEIYEQLTLKSAWLGCLIIWSIAGIMLTYEVGASNLLLQLAGLPN